MKLFRDFNSIFDYCEYSTGKFIKYDSLQSSKGLYKIVDNNTFTAIYVEDSKLFFIYDSNTSIITDDYQVVLSKTNKKYWKKAEFYKADSLILEFTYEWQESYVDIPPFSFIEDEDFDWGLFLSNIINDKKRKDRFIKAKMGEAFD